MLWVAFALMTGAAVLAVLWPLGRRRGAAEAVAVDRAFYETELASIDRDERLGLITAAEATSARTEAARRLLAAAPAAEPAAPPTRWSARTAALVALIAVPALSLGIYAALGSPDYPDQPLSARVNAPAGDDLEISIAKVQKHLAENPDDLRGWQIIAPVYMKLGRAKEGAEAFRNLIRLQGPQPDLMASYGEALIYAANGQVTGEAREVFARVLSQDPTSAQARFYLGLGAEQAGDTEAAIKAYGALIAEQPDAPFVPMLRERIAKLGGQPPAGTIPAPPAGPAADIASLPPADRDAMIRSMVDRLSARLASEGGTVDAWSQLIRAYTVLREPDKARDALANGRKALATSDAALATLDALARELGLGG